MAAQDVLSIGRVARTTGTVGMPPVNPVGRAPSVRLGATRPVDTYAGSKEINPFGLQTFSENQQMRGLLKSNVSAMRHRTMMNTIANIADKSV